MSIRRNRPLVTAIMTLTSALTALFMAKGATDLAAASLLSLDSSALSRRETSPSRMPQRQSEASASQLLANPQDMIRAVPVIPPTENGRRALKLYGIRQDSLLDRLGLQNGDSLRTINGYDVATPDGALEAYSRLREANCLGVNVVRRGTPPGAPVRHPLSDPR